MSSVIFFNSQETAGEPICCPNCRKKLNREQVSLDRLIFECITLIWLKIRKRPRGQTGTSPSTLLPIFSWQKKTVGGWGGPIEGEKKTKVMQRIKDEEWSIFD